MTAIKKHYLLSEKVDAFKRRLNDIGVTKGQTADISIYESSAEHYRMRAEFRVWHEGQRTDYAMHHPDTKEIYTLENFPIASLRINQAMPLLMKEINQYDLLRRRLFQVEFLSTLRGELLISLIYHKQLNEQWDALAKELEVKLDAHIIGRARKQKRVLSQEFVMETLTINNQSFYYQQVENSFTQPNAVICQKMIEWTLSKTKNSQAHDLLELYCGNGNFTLPLSQNFSRVLATEVSKTSVRSAQFNIEKNAIDNVVIARLSSEEFVEAYTKVRPFRRLKDVELDSYHFSAIFVDPPRAGLDETTLKLAQRFQNIVYISCNPNTLIENLAAMTTHKITALAVFDQFPNTPHLEVGVILTKCD